MVDASVFQEMAERWKSPIVARTEIETFTSQLNDILLSMEKLGAVDTAGVPPMTHAMIRENAFRNDAVQESLSTEAALANAPDRRGDFFRVPKVIE